MSVRQTVVRRFFEALEARDIDAALDCLARDIRLETASRTETGHVSIRIPLRMLMDYGFASHPSLTDRQKDGAVLADIQTPLGPIVAQCFVGQHGLIDNIVAV